MDVVQRKRMGVVGAVIMAAGIITLLVAAWQASEQMIVLQTWKPVTAQLVKTDVQNDKLLTNIHTARADNYLVSWTFRFTVGGVAHVATADPGSHGNYTQMLKWSGRFQPGEQVTIHHKPDNPEVISAAQWDWITFYRAGWVGAWGIGIIVLGFVMRFFSSRVSTYSYKTSR